MSTLLIDKHCPPYQLLIITNKLTQNLPLLGYPRKCNALMIIYLFSVRLAVAIGMTATALWAFPRLLPAAYIIVTTPTETCSLHVPVEEKSIIEFQYYKTILLSLNDERKCHLYWVDFLTTVIFMASN